jgi:hypothetical protein
LKVEPVKKSVAPWLLKTSKFALVLMIPFLKSAMRRLDINPLSVKFSFQQAIV